jgi:glycosyltransferase involved in cell wall biosynthesis
MPNEGERATARSKEAPIVIISSYPPRLCGIATFAEEAREFIQARHPEREVMVLCHADGLGSGTIPVIDNTKARWWEPVAEEIARLDPYAIHIQHEYGLYEYHDAAGEGDRNAGFLELLSALKPWPTVVEPHTIHGRLCDHEVHVVREMTERADVVLFKCHYQKWRLDWNFQSRRMPTPTNVMVVPHGARPDRRWSVDEVVQLKHELGFDAIPGLGAHYVGLVGWIQRNKRWDILTSMWEGLAAEIKERTGEDWDLLAAGDMRDPNDREEYLRYRSQLEAIQKKGLAYFYEFIPRGDLYYKVMACCDFVVLPTVDETQSGTLARIISLNKPFVTTAPMEGLTAQTLESGGGLLFSTKEMLHQRVVRLATDENLRMALGNNLKKYLDEVASWTVVAAQYDQAYDLARVAKQTGLKPVLPLEF